MLALRSGAVAPGQQKRGTEQSDREKRKPRREPHFHIDVLRLVILKHGCRGVGGIGRFIRAIIHTFENVCKIFLRQQDTQHLQGGTMTPRCNKET